MGAGKVRCVTIDPHEPHTLYAGVEPIDMFVSNDEAKSWTRLDSVWKVPWVESVRFAGRGVEPHIRNIVFDPKKPNTIYATLQVGFILNSTDGGVSWKLLDKGLDADVHTIVIDSLNSDFIVVSTGGGYFRNKGQTRVPALYISNDGGESWLPTATNFTQDFSIPLVRDPKNYNIHYSSIANGSHPRWRRPTGAESLILRTEDGGKTWDRLDIGFTEMSMNFPQSLVIDEAQREVIFAGLDNGNLYSSVNSGSSWARLDVTVPNAVSDMQCVHS